MRTTLDLPENLLNEAMKITHTGTIRGVIDNLSQITRNKVSANGVEYYQNSTPTDEQERILNL